MKTKMKLSDQLFLPIAGIFWVLAGIYWWKEGGVVLTLLFFSITYTIFINPILYKLIVEPEERYEEELKEWLTKSN